MLIVLLIFALLWFSTDGNRFFSEKENEDYSQEIKEIYKRSL